MAKNKILYLLGAGASRNAIPLVINFSEALKELAVSITLPKNPGLNSDILLFIQDLNWLAEQGDKHQTVDSFAKFCYNKRMNNEHHANFVRLKKTLAHFFSVQQLVNNKRDNRYLHFLNRLIIDQNPFPDNVKILNWNYDFQMQLASNEYRREELKDFHSHKPSFIHYYPHLGSYGNALNRNPDTNFDMIHLNGVAGLYFDWSNNAILHYNLDYGINSIEEYFTRIRNKPVEGVYNTLTFAFENPVDYIYLSEKRKYIERMVQETDYLVVIGYSFPFYNSEMDDFIFNILKKSRIKKIYIQNTSANGDFPESRYKLPSVKYEHSTNCTSFHIPEETNQERKISTTKFTFAQAK